MPGGTNAQSLAYQKELLYPEISVLFQQDTTLLDKIEEGKDKLKDLEQSTRFSRLPLEILAGGKGRQVNPDGGNAGRGSVPTPDVAQMTPVFFDFVTEYSKLYEVATDSKEKAIEPAAKRSMRQAVDQFRAFLESLLNTDGSATLDTVVSATGSQIVVNNANQFADNMDYQVFSSLGGTNRGPFTVASMDANNKTLFLNGPIPVGTTTGDLLIIDGAPGIAASSLFGVEYHQVNSNTGTWMQLDRSAYPGKLSTPTVNLNNQSLTPQSVRLGLFLVKRALGVNTPDMDGLMWQMNGDQQAAWENTGLIVTQVIQNQLGGSASEDMLKKMAPKTMAGRPILESINAVPGRIDGLCLKHWLKTTTQPFGPLEFGGQTQFPTYSGADGALQFNTMSVLWCGFQVATTNPRAGVYFQNAAIPANY